MLGYCEARIGGQKYGNEWTGGHRCSRLAKHWIGGKCLCKQHMKREMRTGDVRVKARA